MKVILFGSTGMVGQGALRECLHSPDVTSVLAVVRKPTGQRHPKLRELVHGDFTDFTGVELDGDVVLWCLGVSSNGMSEADYTTITHDYTLAAAKVLARPTVKFIFVSGTGADRDVMWARVKRRTEEALSTMPFASVHVLRPGVIQPLHGIRSRTRLYNLLYPALWPLIQLARVIAPRHVTTTERVGQAMLRVARDGWPERVLDNPQINAAAAAWASGRGHA